MNGCHKNDLLSAMMLIVIVACAANNGSFDMINEAAETISSATVTVSGQTIAFGDIRQGGQVTGRYRVRFDDDFTISIVFESGRKLEKSLGYVTNGFDYSHRFMVSDNDIKVVESNAR